MCVCVWLMRILRTLLSNLIRSPSKREYARVHDVQIKWEGVLSGKEDTKDTAKMALNGMFEFVGCRRVWIPLPPSSLLPHTHTLSMYRLLLLPWVGVKECAWTPDRFLCLDFFYFRAWGGEKSCGPPPPFLVHFV